MNQRIRKIKKHLSDHQDLYVVGAVGVTVGACAALLLRKPNAAAVITQWLKATEKQGLYVYALTKEETYIWDQFWASITGSTVADATVKVVGVQAADPAALMNAVETAKNIV